MNAPHAFLCLRAALGVLIAAPSLGLAQSADAGSGANDTQQSAYRSSVAEETVRKQADKIQAEITELVTELKANGLEGANLQILTDASDHLKNLSQQDMQKVINALQSASISGQAQDRQQSLVTAYQQQKDVSLKLASLAADLAAQESQQEIPSELQLLIARQSANIRQTSTLQAGDQDAQQKTAHELAASEQTSIGGGIDLLAKVLAATPAAPPAGTPANGGADISKAVLAAMNSGTLKDASQAAIALTTSGPFPEAVNKQIAVRDALTSLLRVAESQVDAVTRLEEIKAQLSRIIEDQQELAAVTGQSKLDGPVLAEREAKIDDRTSVTEALLIPVSVPAFNQLSVAEQAMGPASSALAKASDPSATAPQEEAVVVELKKAAALLEQELTSAEKEDALSPVDKLAQLQQLQAEINQAQQKPSVTAADLQKLQQDARDPSPQAADKIADAADQMRQSPSDAAAANSALAQANDIVQKQEDALKQAAQAYQALEQASQQLDQAQKEAAQANQSMQNAQNQPNQDLTQAAHELSQAKANVDQMQQTPGGLPAAAQQALQQASEALKNATNQAVQAQAVNAEAQNQQAMAAMQQAQAGLAQAMAQMTPGPGKGQGQGQGKGEGQNVAQGPGQGQGQGQIQGQNTGGNPQGSGGGDQGDGRQALAGMGAGDRGAGLVVGGLSPKDRAAINQYQAEKSPSEYAPLVQQYLKNLADSAQNH